MSGKSYGSSKSSEREEELSLSPHMFKPERSQIAVKIWWKVWNVNKKYIFHQKKYHFEI